MKDANERIKEAFPEMVPSEGHDFVEEIIGLLRVTRSQRDYANRLCQESNGKFRALKSKIQSDLEYDKIKAQLENLPATWYPALLITLVQAAYNKNVFQHGGASRLVVKIENKRPGSPDILPEAPTLQNWGVWDVTKDCWFLTKSGKPIFSPHKSGANLAVDYIIEYSREPVSLEVRPYPDPAKKPESPIVPGVMLPSLPPKFLREDGSFTGPRE